MFLQIQTTLKSVFQVEKLFRMTASFANFRALFLFNNKPPRSRMGGGVAPLSLGISSSYLLVLYGSETSYSTVLASVPGNRFFWIKCISTLLCFVHYFHCQLRELNWKTPVPCWFFYRHLSFLFCGFRCSTLCCFSLQSLGHFPLVALWCISAKTSAISCYSSWGLCAPYIFPRCQTSRNSAFQDMGWPVRGSRWFLI